MPLDVSAGAMADDVRSPIGDVRSPIGDVRSPIGDVRDVLKALAWDCPLRSPCRTSDAFDCIHSPMQSEVGLVCDNPDKCDLTCICVCHQLPRPKGRSL